MISIEKIAEIEHTEIEIVSRLVAHLQNPCTVQAGDKTYHIREFYLEEAKRIFSSLKNPFAKSFLEGIIEGYS